LHHRAVHGTGALVGEMGLLFRFDFGKKTPGPRLSHCSSSPSPERPCCLVL